MGCLGVNFQRFILRRFKTQCTLLLLHHLTLKECITKTYLYNFDPLKPHFYVVKLGFTGIYVIFLIFLKT